MEKPKRSDSKYWNGTRNFNDMKYDSDLDEYICELEEKVSNRLEKLVSKGAVQPVFACRIVDAKIRKPEINQSVIAKGDKPEFIAEAKWDGQMWWRNNNGYGFTVGFDVTEWIEMLPNEASKSC